MAMKCFACGGAGCEKCEKTGMIDITDCPLTYLTADIEEVMLMADLFKKGLSPVGGLGVLDQTYEFVMASQYIWKLEEMKKAELGILGS